MSRSGITRQQADPDHLTEDLNQGDGGLGGDAVNQVTLGAKDRLVPATLKACVDDPFGGLR